MTEQGIAFCSAGIKPLFLTERVFARAVRNSDDSGILMAVRHFASSRFVFLIIFLIIGSAQAFPSWKQALQTPPPSAPPPTQQPASPTNSLAVVVLDPAHGGADTGARGASGILESDVVLSYARLMRPALEEQGFRVLLTRQANEDPSFDERSQIANGQRGVIFISLHVASTGPPGTVRVYSFPQPAAPDLTPTSSLIPTNLIRWDHAQESYLDSSRKLAELMQAQMAQRFPGSPDIAETAAVRQLRTVAAPAVAIEVSSVSLPDRSPLDRMGLGLAQGVASAVAAFRPIYQAGSK
jgi:N-acetylmuramoyl-L-alanine amidase